MSAMYVKVTTSVFDYRFKLRTRVDIDPVTNDVLYSCDVGRPDFYGSVYPMYQEEFLYLMNVVNSAGSIDDYDDQFYFMPAVSTEAAAYDAAIAAILYIVATYDSWPHDWTGPYIPS